LARNDKQKGAKKKTGPGSTAKGFDRSAPCSDLHKMEEVGHLERGKITLSVNGGILQQEDISNMIWFVAEVISSLSSFV
jgi:fumarylpyruvate hydrolase